MPSDPAINVPAYAVITAARNEEAYLEETIRSVVGQTITPRRWIIVSDGSTDGTDGIVQRYASRHDWITLVRLPARQERNFAAKANAVNAAFMPDDLRRKLLTRIANHD